MSQKELAPNAQEEMSEKRMEKQKILKECRDYISRFSYLNVMSQFFAPQRIHSHLSSHKSKKKKKMKNSNCHVIDLDYKSLNKSEQNEKLFELL